MQTSTFPATWLEVFAEQPLGGNFHLVVHDADAIPDGVMARFASRNRLSETSFVQSPSPTADGADYRHRIFTTESELPFAGHPSVGTAAAVAARRGLTSASFLQETGAGLQRLTLTLTPSTAAVDLRQNPPERFAEPSTAVHQELLAVVGLTGDDAHPTLPPAVVSTGLPTLVLPVSDVPTLGRLRVDLAQLDAALAKCPGRPVTCYVVTPTAGTGATWRARTFTAQVASGEDSATGSAAGPLTAYAADEFGIQSVAIDQGVEMGSPSRLYGRVDGDAVVVSGQARIVGTGTLELPLDDATGPATPRGA